MLDGHFPKRSLKYIFYIFKTNFLHVYRRMRHFRFISTHVTQTLTFRSSSLLDLPAPVKRADTRTETRGLGAACPSRARGD